MFATRLFQRAVRSAANRRRKFAYVFSMAGDTCKTEGSRIHDTRQKKRYFAAAAAAVVASASSLAARKWREGKILTLPLASNCGAFYCGCDQPKRQKLVTGAVLKDSSLLQEEEEKDEKDHVFKREGERSNIICVPTRELNELATTVTRAGLMGKASSVKEELSAIRKWHHSRGFHGGLVLRELTVPLFSAVREDEIGENLDEDNASPGVEEDAVDTIPPDHIHQRECYYLYYEVCGNGEVRQQIFCRGTTLGADVLTGLKSLFKYDDELGCYLHGGFRNHANHLLKDIQPLLIAPTDRRSTIELCGHSLGGAVALIVALKLKKRGYNVIRVTTVAAPKMCDAAAVSILSPLLPRDTLRIEDDLDGVIYLPPFYGSGLGHKLWFVSSKWGRDRSARFIPSSWHSDKDSSVSTYSWRWWVDSSLMNCRLLEVIFNVTSVHRISSYRSRIEDLSREMDKYETHVSKGR